MNIMPPKSYVQAVSQPQRSTYQKDPDVGEGVTKGTVQSFTGRAGQKEGGHQGSVVDGQADGQNVEAGQSVRPRGGGGPSVQASHQGNVQETPKHQTGGTQGAETRPATKRGMRKKQTRLYNLFLVIYL